MEARTDVWPPDGLRLVPHAAGAISPVTSLIVQFWRQGDRLSLIYWLEGDLERVLWPVGSRHQRADGLWRTTCLEAFVRADGDSGYIELNFSPAGEWAAYEFDQPRTGMRPLDAIDIHPWVEPDPNERRFTTAVDFAKASIASKPWRVALAAVIEATDGSISYWALTHPSDKPDFHHPDSFSLTLPPPEPA